MSYAGQRKVSRDIDKKLKKATSSKKSNDKKAETKKMHYYATLMAKNKTQQLPMSTIKFKPSKKHLSILKTISEKGYYKPAYSDQEPATQTLLKNGIAEWKEDYKGIILTEAGKQFVSHLLPLNK